MARVLASIALVLAPCPRIHPQMSAPTVTVAGQVEGPRAASPVGTHAVRSAQTRQAAGTVKASPPVSVTSAGAAAKVTHHAPAHHRRRVPARPAARPTLVLADLGVMRVTKYCATGNRTASGVWPRIGQVATLDRHLPFGTKLRLLGRTTGGRVIDQTFVVTDRIGHGSQVDIYQGGVGDPGCEPRVNRLWGVQHLRVEVVR